MGDPYSLKVKLTLEKYRDNTIEPLKNNGIVRMLSLVLRWNNFDFNGEHTCKFRG